jgi:hypothetical protein
VTSPIRVTIDVDKDDTYVEAETSSGGKHHFVTVEGVATNDAAILDLARIALADLRASQQRAEGHSGR